MLNWRKLASALKGPTRLAVALVGQVSNWWAKQEEGDGDDDDESDDDGGDSEYLGEGNLICIQPEFQVC